MEEIGKVMKDGEVQGIRVVVKSLEQHRPYVSRSFVRRY